ncbi:MAG: UDP-galactopyranose mutase [Verrucomicrobiota bacterium]
MTTVDYLVVGSGLTGSTIGRMLADDGREVLILERRPHHGGNVHDFQHPSGHRIHTYGPHYFRCHSPQVWEFVNRFSKFYLFQPTVKSRINNHYESWPVTQSVLDKYPRWRPPVLAAAPSNFEEACLQKMPRQVYERYVRGYTRRQWGMDPRRLEPGLAQRIRINANDQTTLLPRHRHQALPMLGYAHLMENMVAGVPCLLGVDYLKHRSEYRARKAVIYTGPIDEWFGFSSGRLGYRGQRRVHQHLADQPWHQPCVQVNHPDAGSADPIRTIEWKHLLPEPQQKRAIGTFLTREFPFSPEDPEDFEYPIPAEPNRKLYQQYRSAADGVPNLIVCGRLGTYRYLDMDVAIALAMRVASDLCERKSTDRRLWMPPPAPQAVRRL